MCFQQYHIQYVSRNHLHMDLCQPVAHFLQAMSDSKLHPAQVTNKSHAGTDHCG